MRTIKQVILAIFLLVSSASGLTAQNGTLSSGGVATGAGGSATYSIGQVNYITAAGAGYRITEGLQQPFFCFPIAATCSNNNSVIYYGYAGDQTATIKAIPSSGVAPFTVSITMNRPLNCNVITSSGDEIWSGIGGTTINNICPETGSGLTPVSTGTVLALGDYYSVNVTLLQDAVFTATITDANGCIATCTTSIHAEDARCFTGNSGISKITVCHQTGNSNNPCVNICVDESAVSLHLGHGDFLGNCTPNCVDPVYNNRASQTIMEAVTPTTDILKVNVFPNPTSTEFNLVMESANPQQKGDLKITNAQGQLMETRGINNGQVIKIGQHYRPGLYFMELIQGNERKRIKLIKLFN